MEPVSTIEGGVTFVDQDDVDTDQIIPARYMKRVERTGYGGRQATTSEHVARVVVKAATARRPRTRYPVTLSARLLIAGRALLPDRMWDALLRRQFRS